MFQVRAGRGRSARNAEGARVSNRFPTRRTNAQERTGKMASADLLTKEMESFYRRYIEAFNSEELTGLAELFSYPWGSIGGRRGMLVIRDQADFMRAMGKSKGVLRDRGWARTGIDM